MGARAEQKIVSNVISSIAWVVGLMVGLGTVGKFIDFYIGKPGQEKVKDWLLRGWTKFDDMKLGNFSEKEALYFIGLQDRLFGAKLFSWRRMLSVLGLICLLFLSALAVGIHQALDTREWVTVSQSPFIGLFVISVGAFALSISVSRFISINVLRLARLGNAGPLPYMLLLCIHLGLFAYWRPIIEIFQAVLFILIFQNVVMKSINFGFLINMATSGINWSVSLHSLIFQLKEFFSFQAFQVPLNNGEPFTRDVLSYTCFLGYYFLSYFANIFRLVVALVILCAFVLRAWLSRFLSKIWQRICEDNRGAFTLISCGVGAVAGGMKALLGTA